jgi:hypothetical protein
VQLAVRVGALHRTCPSTPANGRPLPPCSPAKRCSSCAPWCSAPMSTPMTGTGSARARRRQGAGRSSFF